jgi:hypothetical protein
MTNSTVRAGLKIPEPDQKKNFLSLSYSRLIVKVINAFLNLRTKNGQLLLSDHNGLLALEAELAAGGSTSSTDYPWQITLQDTPDNRTIRVGGAVGAERVWMQRYPENNSPVATALNGYGTNTDITIPSGSPDGTYDVWLKCYDDAGTWKALVQVQDVDTFPTDWDAYPSPQTIDLNYATPYAVGYILVGQVLLAGTATTIKQLIFDNPTLADYTNDNRLGFNAAYAGLGNITWNTAATYRQGHVVNKSGALYFRYGLSFGNNGGDPAGTWGVDTDFLPML